MLRAIAVALAAAVATAALSPASVPGDKGEKGGIRPTPVDRLTIYVSATGRLFVPDGQSVKVVTEAEITRLARDITARVKAPQLVVQASRDASIRDIRRVAKAASAGGISKVAFGTWGDEPPRP